MPAATLDVLGIKPSARAQELSVAQFVAIADYVATLAPAAV
jgi:16S rRNA A1518/A1519 N6-dimethyltransferase RsmA/KsgA/DIM1 with predicted DNA glycosylase/AP lyase activity